MPRRLACWLYAKGLYLLLFTLASLLTAAQAPLNDVLSRLDEPSFAITETIALGDSVVFNDSINPIDTSALKTYQRWRRDHVKRQTYYGTANATSSSIRAYMAGAPLFCTSGPQGYNWQSVGPNPTSSNFQELGLVNAIEADPSNSNILYAGTWESGIWK